MENGALNDDGNPERFIVVNQVTTVREFLGSNQPEIYVVYAFFFKSS